MELTADSGAAMCWGGHGRGVVGDSGSFMLTMALPLAAIALL